MNPWLMILPLMNANFLGTSLWCFPCRHLLVQNQQWKHQHIVWNLFKVKYKDIRTTSLTSFWCFYCWLWTYFTHCFTDISHIVDFEQVYSGWVSERFDCLNKLHKFEDPHLLFHVYIETISNQTFRVTIRILLENLFRASNGEIWKKCFDLEKRFDLKRRHFDSLFISVFH